MTKQSHSINVENGQIDEIVIRHGARVWLHMEQMSSTGFSAGVSYLYLDLYLARRAKDLDTSDTIAQSLSEALDGALAADEAKTIGAMLRAGRALGWIEKAAS